ncbi:hypothetical protein [Chryseobacterium indoltheticum]|uniref:hypothetical protein n=1 Tax=Chryseobacterium indoltheticum TaxID=254 RepID=UPI0028EAA30F|nr:hypothetical protein [Chryseobacterium indoltheticum]
MRTKSAQWSPLKSDIKASHGYLSFNCTLINLDVVGVRIIDSGEVVIIFYRGPDKTGYMYEGERLNDIQVFNLFKIVPDNYNDLEAFEKMDGRVEILAPPRDNYVFINDMEVVQK